LDNTICPSKIATITFNVEAPANGGQAAQVFCGESDVLLEGTNNTTGTWIYAPGSPISGAITSGGGNTANVLLSPNSLPYTLRYTLPATGNCPATFDDVEITVDPIPAPQPDAGPDQNLCLGDLAVADQITLSAGNVPTIGTPTWTNTFRPMGSPVPVINNPGNQITTVDNVGTPGLYVFEWTFDNDSCVKLADPIRVSMYEPPTNSNAGLDNLEACLADFETSANAPTVGIGTWSIVS